MNVTIYIYMVLVQSNVLHYSIFGFKSDWMLLKFSHLVPRTPAVPFDQFGWKCAIRCFGP